MKYYITESDKASLLQTSITYKYRLYIVDRSGSTIDMLEGIQSIGEYSIDSQSDVRRVSSFVLQLDECCRKKSLEQKLYSWLGYDFRLQIGIYQIRRDAWQWYDCGYYAITAANTSYSATANQLSVSLSDRTVRWNGTRSGVIGGAPTIRIPVQDADGNQTVIKEALIAFLKLSEDIPAYIVDDIGEFYALPENNSNWEQYRKEHPEWNVLPYDLEFSGDATIYDIVREICGLYPNYQHYFDCYGNFCVSMIPSCEKDPIVLDSSYLDRILIADNTENVSYDVEAVKNVTEVFGKIYDIDRMSDICSTSSNIYSITLADYTSYKGYEYIAFKPDSDNIADMKLRINDLEVLPLYLEGTSTYIEPSVMSAGNVYVVKIKRTNGAFCAYYLGQYQPHALCVLTDKENDPHYTKAYFSRKYNCDEKNIVLRVEDSPFCVQKIGEVLDYKSGDDFEHIESDSVARENAIYYNRKSTSYLDTVTIVTKMIPFLDVHQKVSYRRKQETEKAEYIIQSISHNLDEMTSTITMYRFYPLYYA